MSGTTKDEIRRIGKYSIERELGRGGMGVVYLATDTDLGRSVALKMVQPSLARDERSLARFKKEARAVAALSHPNIVHINALTEIDGLVLIEMPHLAAGSLRDVTHRQLPAEAVASILDKILDALACCHDCGIIHRDVKPSNILFDTDGVPKLSDFGAVALLESDWSQGQGERTLTLSFSGTPQYCCPEAWDGKPPTPLWDLYALGMVAREMLCATSIRPLATPLAHIRQLLESEEEPIRRLVPELSEPLGELIDSLSARDPERRPANAAEAQTRLRQTPEFVQVASADARTLDLSRAGLRLRRAPAGRTRRWSRWRPRIYRAAPWFLVAALAVALLVNGVRPGRPWTVPVGAPDRTTRATAPTQWERFQDASPGAEEIAHLARDTVSGRSQVYALRSARAPGLDAPFIVRKLPDARAIAMGKLDHDLHYLTLTPDAGGTRWGVTGFAGDFTPGEVPIPRLARVYGAATWDGNLGAPFWLELTYESELAQEEWSDALVASPEAAMTDTEVVLSWERDRSAMPFLFRELSPRFPKQLTPFFEVLPAVADARLVARPGLSERDIAGSTTLDAVKALLESTLPGRPATSGAWLAADRDSGQFRIVIGLPDASGPPEAVDVCVLPRYGVPADNSPFLWVSFGSETWRAARVLGEERTPVPGGWAAELVSIADGYVVLVTLGEEALYWNAPPAPGEWHRVNATVKMRDESGERQLVWGWPEVFEVGHGALVELQF